MVVAAVMSKDDKGATNTTCVRSEQVIDDTDTSNDCASASVKTFGRPN